MNDIKKNLLKAVADLHDTPSGAYNIRENSKLAARGTTANIDIVTKTDKPGIDIIVKAGTKKESVHIPVIITESGIDELVYNDFIIGEDSDIVIVAGCGIHTTSDKASSHDGVHSFRLGKNARVKYVEKHYGEGEGSGARIMNPKTLAYLDEGAVLEFESVQIGGINDTKRETYIEMKANSEVVVTERIMTHDSQYAESKMNIDMLGAGSKARIISRSVARDESKQVFYPSMRGDCDCFGHVQCDSIIMDKATVRSIPEIYATSVDARLVHEAAIGKIAGDQLIKLMTLGLTQEEAEEKILSGFLS